MLSLLMRADFRGFDLLTLHVVELALGKALYMAARVWILYVALEPYVRRKWPRVLISWSRLLSGRWRDPMVGRDMLAGVIGGLALYFVVDAQTVWPRWIGLRAANPRQPITSAFGSARHVLYFMFRAVPEFTFGGIAIVALIVIVRAITRRHRIGVAAAWIFIGLQFLGGQADWRAQLMVALIGAAIVVGTLLRFGLLGVTAAGTMWGLNGLPMTLDSSAWYFGRSLLVIAIIAALALAGAIIAIGNKPLFGTPLLDE
jgi:hypothetical protein